MATYDPTTKAGKVRLLIPDTDTAAAVFTDAEIDAFLSLEGNNIFLAAASALEVIASDRALTLQVVKVLDIQTDGAKLSDALLKRAEMLRKRAEIGDQDYEGFEIAEQVPNHFAARERVYNQLLRRGGI